MQDTSQANPTSTDDTTTGVVPNLSNLEYSTPSAYVDPDLPLSPLPPEDESPETPEPPESSETPETPPEPAPEPAEEPAPEPTPETPPIPTNVHGAMADVAKEISTAKNILIALSSSPSVDELAAAICLSLFLSQLDKHAVAIYSGSTPGALEFLKPERTFRNSPDVLQDFVIAVDKNKADHLRYKLDGEYVKIFITPYKNRIASEDLEFSYGDYNVDLVLGLNVKNVDSLDPALSEHNRIMQDATVINISTSSSGGFGQIEWNDALVSSISEMTADLLFSAFGDTKLNTEEATALLTGIVSATDHFSSASTRPSTMQIASRLIESGADPQLVAAGITGDADADSFNFASESHTEESHTPSYEDAPTLPSEQPSQPEPPVEQPSAQPEPPVEASSPAEETREPNESEDTSLLDELKATEASLSGLTPEAPAPAPAPAMPEPSSSSLVGNTIAPPAIDTTNKYSQMLDEALSEAPSVQSGAPMESTLPPVVNNPAVSSAPAIAPAPDVTNIPDINYGQTVSDQLLPPPPTPPIDMNAPMPVPAPGAMPPVPNIPQSPAPVPAIPATPEAAPTPVIPTAPAATTPPPAPDAFTIPGI